MICITSPLDISLSLSQQNPSFAFGPTSLSPNLAPLGSLAGSGKLARWVGGGEPEAADRTERGGVGVMMGDEGSEGDACGDGEDANGLGGDDIVREVWVVGERK
jgi:hypothetical protein